MRTVLIVDDSAAFRTAARALLEAEQWIVVGESADGRSALRAIARVRPHVVLVDIGLPDIDGFELAQEIARSDGKPRVVLCSTRPERVVRQRLAAAPVEGFIAKDELSGARLRELLAATG